MRRFCQSPETTSNFARVRASKTPLTMLKRKGKMLGARMMMTRSSVSG